MKLGTILPVTTITVKRIIESRMGYRADCQIIHLGKRECKDSEPLCDASTLRSLPKKDVVTFSVTVKVDEAIEPVPAPLELAPTPSVETRGCALDALEQDARKSRRSAKRSSIA